VTEQEGSSLVELLVASFVTVLAASIVASAVLGPLRLLTDVVAPDEDAAALDSAAEVVARVVRSARPSARSLPVVAASEQEVVVRLEHDGEERLVRLSLDGGTLTLAAIGIPGPPPGLPEGVLIDGLEADSSRILLFGDDGALLDPIDPQRIRAVGIVLERSARTATRVVSLRVHEPHQRVRAW
jgi:hypothetical protein